MGAVTGIHFIIEIMCENKYVMSLR